MNEYNLFMKDVVPLIAEAVNRGQTFTMKVHGNSMYPFLLGGRDFVTFTKLNEKIKVGDIILFQRSETSFVMHRVYRINADGTLDFVGDGQIEIEKNIKKEQLIAFVSEAKRNGKKISCKKGLWHRIMTGYMNFRVKAPATAKFVYLAVCKINRIFKKTG